MSGLEMVPDFLVGGLSNYTKYGILWLTKKL